MAVARSRASKVDTARPALVRRVGATLVEAFRAGLLGAGTWLWIAGVLIGARRQRIVGFTEDQILLFATAAALGFGLGLGFQERPRSFLGLFARSFGGIAIGVMLGAAAAIVTDKVARDTDGRVIGLSVAGVAYVVIAIAWRHGRVLHERLRGSPRARVVAATAGAAVVLATALPASPRLRCALGSAKGCRRAAEDAMDDGDRARLIALARRGCDGSDGPSCRIVGDAFWKGQAGVPSRDGAHAEPFYRDACALGDDEGCDLLHLVELHAKCAADSASACRELGDLYRRSNLDEARRFHQVACLLGDDGACADVR